MKRRFDYGVGNMWIDVGSVNSNLTASYILDIRGDKSDGVIELNKAEIEQFEKLQDMIEKRLLDILEKGIHKTRSGG